MKKVITVLMIGSFFLFACNEKTSNEHQHGDQEHGHTHGEHDEGHNHDHHDEDHHHEQEEFEIEGDTTLDKKHEHSKDHQHEH